MRLQLSHPYAWTAAAMRVLERAGAREVEHGFGSTGAVVEFTVPASAEAAVRGALREASAGGLAAERKHAAVLYRNEPA